MRDDTDSYE